MTIETPPPGKLIYNDYQHAYYLNGRRCKSVTALAKIPCDTYALDAWKLRQVAIGMALDANLIENMATNLDNKERGDAVVGDAMKTADAHRKADRGTQMHRVLELVLLNKPEHLLTEQQRRDADVLRRTLDRYHLAPYEGMTEQFVAWPHQAVGGRFDAVLERRGREQILVDLKTGAGAIEYPQQTAIQLALYARAPWISSVIEIDGDRSIVEQWRKMPEHLDYRHAYVLYVPPEAEVGTLHEIDIEHGWAGARKALEIVMWRKEKAWGKDIVREVPDGDPVIGYTLADQVATAESVEELRELWREAQRRNEFDSAFDAALRARLAYLAPANEVAAS